MIASKLYETQSVVVNCRSLFAIYELLSPTRSESRMNQCGEPVDHNRCRPLAMMMSCVQSNIAVIVVSSDAEPPRGYCIHGMIITGRHQRLLNFMLILDIH
jgi:hypothetical protein